MGSLRLLARLAGEKPFLFTNCKTGEGIPELVERIRTDLLFDLRLPDRKAS